MISKNTDVMPKRSRTNVVSLVVVGKGSGVVAMIVLLLMDEAGVVNTTSVVVV